MKSAVIVLLVALVAVACGSTPSSKTPSLNVATSSARSSTSGASPGPSPTSNGTSVLILVETSVPAPDRVGTLELFREDGTSQGTLPLAEGSSVLAVAGQRIFVRSANGAVRAVSADGSSKQLEPAGAANGIGGLVASPDGRRWLWASQTPDTTSQSIWIDGDGMSARKIADLAYPTVLVPYSWTSQGIVLQSLPMDFFGYRPFYTVMDALGGVQLVDPTTGTVQTFHLPGCIFSDETSAGTIACFPTDTGHLVPNRHALRIIGPSGKAVDFALSVPRFNYVGDAYFSPDATMLSVAGATGDATPLALGATSTKPEQYGTDLVTVDTAAIVRFGPTGTRPAMGLESWLPDGQLVLWRPDSIGGDPGLYVLDPRGPGTGSEILVSGTPVGYLSGQ